MSELSSDASSEGHERELTCLSWESTHLWTLNLVPAGTPAGVTHSLVHVDEGATSARVSAPTQGRSHQRELRPRSI